jgi:putative transposase
LLHYPTNVIAFLICCQYSDSATVLELLSCQDGQNEEIIVHRGADPYALRQVEAGTPVTDVCRKLGIAEQTFYRWKRKYAGMGVTELCRLKQLEEGTYKLKALVADVTLDEQMLQEMLRKCSDGSTVPRAALVCVLVVIAIVK